MGIVAMLRPSEIAALLGSFSRPLGLGKGGSYVDLIVVCPKGIFCVRKKVIHGDNLHSQPLGYNAWCLFHTKSHAPTKILRNKSAVC